MRIAFLLSAASLVAIASPAIAQEHATKASKSDIVVTGTLTVEAAKKDIEQTPGGVALVSAADFRDTPVKNIKDILEYVPGVIVQPRMGDDARVSVRGSGLSRAYGNRGIAMYIDGIPLNTSDGLLDFFEIDPSAYQYVEVYKGANALRYGANALGGAINLVTPTGRDASALAGRFDTGSFGYVKGQVSTGGVSGSLDYFATVSAQSIDGYREHSDGNALRGNINIGYRVSPDADTRFYAYATSTNQRIPGEVTKDQALNSPRSANPVWVAQDQQRNVDSIRLANKTTLRFGLTTVELGAFYNNRTVDHPIFQYLDFTVDDFGGFVRAVDDRKVGGIRNRLTLGASLHNGTIDTEQFVNVAAEKGALVGSTLDRSKNFSIYGDNALFVQPDVALIIGLQYLHASRDRRDRFLSDGDQSGKETYDLWSPKAGVLWNVKPEWQIFANISRSVEVPSYDVNIFTNPTQLKPQRATTYEIGTRGKVSAIQWDLSLYRSEIEDELQCLTTGPFSACSAINADRTAHQGVEAGLGGSIPLAGSGDAVAFNFAYTFSDFHFDADTLYGDNELPGVPRHLLRGEMLFQHRSGFYAGPNVEWSPGGYFADNANSLTVDAYALLNFKAGFDVGGNWSAYIEGRNLTDEAYISTVAIAGVADENSAIFNPGTGRSIFGGVRFSF